MRIVGFGRATTGIASNPASDLALSEEKRFSTVCFNVTEADLDKQAVHRAGEQMAARGLRVLAFARRRVDANHVRLEHSHVATGLTFLGLQGMIDPPRPEAIKAVRQC
jgi:magnesium-transporting ATPase (P-type)